MVTMATVEANSVAEAVAKVDEIHKAFGSNVDVDITILAEDKKSAVLGDVIENMTKAVEKASLGYSFPWLKGTQEENIMTGAIEFTNFAGIGDQPQKVASAASAIETAGLMGASYKPILFVGTQIVRGTNYWFFAEQTLITNPPKKRIVKMAVNEFQGKFEIVKNSIKVVIE